MDSADLNKSVNVDGIKFGFKVLGTDGKYLSFNENNKCTGSSAKGTEVRIDGAGIATLSNIPTGTYTVEETSESGNPAGYTFSSSSIPGKGSVTVTNAADPAKVTVTNSYARNLGILTVSKQLAVKNGDDPITGTYNYQFVVKNTDTQQYLKLNQNVYKGPAASQDLASKITVSNGETATLSDIPAGNYQVIEIAPEKASVPGYVFINSKRSVFRRVT